jgi:hypothetical protein
VLSKRKLGCIHYPEIMARSTNPFEDSFEEDVPHVGSEKLLPSTNPFESNPNLIVDDPDPAADEYDDEMLEENTHDQEGGQEASWQFLGDLPYRRVPIYSNVNWTRRRRPDEEESFNHGLAAFPSSYIRRSDFIDTVNAREMLSNTTVTKVAGCPHGGPIAAMTLPILGAMSDASFRTTEIRVMTNAGHSLANIECPPPGLSRMYTAADITTIGFTDRTVLIVVMRDSLCLTYDLSGNPTLPPFHIMPSSEGKGTELLQASVYEGGVAVLSMAMQAAIAEFLDDHDDPSYADEIHLPLRKIFPSSTPAGNGTSGGMQADALPQSYAIVTALPSAAYAR